MEALKLNKMFAILSLKCSFAHGLHEYKRLNEGYTRLLAMYV